MTMTVPPTSTPLRRLNDHELNLIVANLNVRPMSAEFAMNRYSQDGMALLGEVLALRRERQETLSKLRALPLDDVKLEDGLLEITDKAQAFWLEYQRGYWGEQEGSRLKRAAERAAKETQAAKAREERMAERIVGLEAAYGEAQQLAAKLNDTVRELTESLAMATARESAHAERVRVLEADRAELERQTALEVSIVRAERDATHHDWANKVTVAIGHMDQARAELLKKEAPTVKPDTA